MFLSQTFPQDPQLSMSEVRSIQVPPQSVSPGAQPPVSVDDVEVSVVVDDVEVVSTSSPEEVVPVSLPLSVPEATSSGPQTPAMQTSPSKQSPT